jgi:hypothetical protein
MSERELRAEVRELREMASVPNADQVADLVWHEALEETIVALPSMFPDPVEVMKREMSKVLDGGIGELE